MMWPFSKKGESFEKSGLFDGFTDWHSHILPGVDDGIRTMDESLALLRDYEQAGVRRVWLTPHIMEEVANTPDGLRSRFEELKSEYKGPIELRLAAENMLDTLFTERVNEKNLLPIGEKGEHLLIETSYVNPPLGMQKMIESVFSTGLIPVLAHPERYRYMEEDDYLSWKEKGVMFQSNIMSLLGVYGETAREKCEWLLKEGMVDIVGSDLHRHQVLKSILPKRAKDTEAMRLMLEIAANPAIK